MKVVDINSGLVFPEVGQYKDLPATEYFSWFAASNSILKTIDSKSPAHAYLGLTQPSNKTSEALEIGTLVHERILFPELYLKTRVKLPKLDKRKKEDKQKFEELLLQYPESSFVSETQYDEVERIYEAAFKNPKLKIILNSLLHREESFVWQDDSSGALCKARIDAISKLGFVADIKTTKSAAKKDFIRSVYEYGYHTQGAHYLRAAKHFKLDADQFLIIAIEKETGFIALYELDKPTILAGENQIDRLLPIWQKCVTENNWFAYPNDIQLLNIPNWAINKINESNLEA